MGGGLHLLYQLPNHLLKFTDKLLRIVFVGLYLAQFLLPLACQFGTFQQFIANKAYELNACVCGN